MENIYKSLIFFSLCSSGFLSAFEESECKNSSINPYEIANCQQGNPQATLSAQHREANGIGYNRGYSSVDFFWSLKTNGDFHPFIDLRSHLTNDGFWAANGGIGVRGFSSNRNRIYGVNVFYDYRNAPHASFQQMGGGIEVFSCKWDFHINGYFPFTKKSKLYRKGFYRFRNHQAIFQKKYQTALTGVEIGLGRPLFITEYFDMHAKLGGYYFRGRFKNQAGGGLFRLQSNITPYFSIEGQFSYDSLFKDLYQGMVSINYPLGNRPKRMSVFSCNPKSMQAVDRFEMIVTKKHRKKGFAIDPITRMPLNFFFVNNTSSSSGTFESPFPTLAQAQAAANPGDVIYVFPGDGTTRGMDQGIVLQDRQQLIGSGVSATFLTEFGTLKIPAQTNTSPSITTISGGNVITFNDQSTNNVISGFNILFNTMAISYSGMFSIENLSILNNNFINLTNASNTVSIRNPSGTFLCQNNTFGLSTIPLTIDFTFVLGASLPSPINLTILNNSFNNSSAGIDIIATGFPNDVMLNINASFNTFNLTPSSDAFILTTNLGSPTTLNTNISLTNNVCANSGFLINLVSTSPSIITANALISGNTIFAAQNSIELLVTGSTFLNLNINKNQMLYSTNGTLITNNSGQVTLNLNNNNSTTFNNAVIGYTLTNNSTFLMTVQSPNATLSGVAALNSGSSPLPNSDTTIGSITTTGTFDYEIFPPGF